ncbi:deoxyribonuclease-1-like 1 isoform X2 [Dromiciops gliroides]|uniref:deoxyribonuclease-1-like 1 isoform X2 n=1 Tax=Dromiciops gliroides TaxID=33562 RepID=UPI001CC6C68C|nr:deoxyribonuclease-1-like 1 isoform X2 [Dromiciops gliroides]
MPSPAPMLLFILLLAGMTTAFRICAFNAQRLTVAKVAKVHIMDTMVRILARCDITVLQEVVDTSGDAIPLLLRDLNRFDDSGPYNSLSSPLLGRSTYMEKYVYVYRSRKTQVLDSYVYNDKTDVFAREPFVAQFSLPSKDCSSLSKKRQGELLLRTKPGFHWAIPDGEDTTVRDSTHCTYDRIVVHGEHCQGLVKWAAAFRFPQSFQLTEAEALNISDHYPVEVELSGSPAWPLAYIPLNLAMLLLLSGLDLIL